MPTLSQIAELLGPRLIDVFSEEPTEDGRRRAAVMLLLREPAGGPPEGVELLLIKRAENPRDPWSGHMALPGGRWEEVGVEVPIGRVLGRLERLSPRNPRLPPVDITPYVALAPEGAEVRPNHEVADFFWIPVEELRASGPSAVFALEMLGEQRDWPAYPYREHLIWGLTERILSDFLATLT
jgi:hypothetical protein